MKSIIVKATNNGWLVIVNGFMKANGPYVYKSTEVLTMLEFLGELTAESKVKVDRR